MNKVKLINRDLKTIFSFRYNREHWLSALVRYSVYLLLKWSGIKKCRLIFWGDRKLHWYSDSIQSCWLLFNKYIDYEEFIFLSRFLREDDVFFDIGANLGYYSIWVSKFIDTGKMVLFEPDEENFERLKLNCALNIGNFELNRLVVSDSSGLLKFSRKKDVLNHIVSDSIHLADDSDYCEIQSVSIDAYCKLNNIEKINYMKIDVEGFELDVLKGCEVMMKTGKIDVIQFELEEDNALRNSGYLINDVLDKIESCGFILCKYDVQFNKLVEISYSYSRDNYLMVMDINKINQLIQKTK
jgi:FkbM family methyltransferase